MPGDRGGIVPEWFPGRRSPVGVFLDFDGTLSRIVPTPEEARPVDGVPEALTRLAEAGAVVVVISGRRAREVARLVRAPVRCIGLYGLEDEDGPTTDAGGLLSVLETVLPDVERAAALVPGSRVEHKGFNVAVHYRAAPDLEAARRVLLERLGAVAAGHGYRLLEGKRVIELGAGGGPTKGDAVAAVAREEGVAAAMYAGDDVADLQAFAALDRLAREGITTLKVAVRHEEAPAELLDAADLSLDGPEAMVGLLGEVETRIA